MRVLLISICIVIYKLKWIHLSIHPSARFWKSTTHAWSGSWWVMQPTPEFQREEFRTVTNPPQGTQTPFSKWVIYSLGTNKCIFGQGNQGGMGACVNSTWNEFSWIWKVKNVKINQFISVEERKRKMVERRIVPSPVDPPTCQVSACYLIHTGVQRRWCRRWSRM